MRGRFQLQPDGTRSRVVMIDHTAYRLIVPEEVWKHNKVSAHVTYWIRRMKQGKQVSFKYGRVEVVKEPTSENIHTCTECNKTYESRDSLYKHIKRDHTVLVQPYKEVPTNIRTEGQVTNQHIINNTNNTINTIHNTINLTMRPFGEENPQWLTARVLYEAIQNLNTAIPRLLKEKHFNDKFPENQNIQISDVRHLNKRLRVFEKTGWRIRNREQVLRTAIDKAYDLLSDAVNNDPDDTDDEDTDETKLSRKEIRRLHTSRRAKRTIERALKVFDEFHPYTTPTAENINDEVDTLLLDSRERQRESSVPDAIGDQ